MMIQVKHYFSVRFVQNIYSKRGLAPKVGTGPIFLPRYNYSGLCDVADPTSDLALNEGLQFENSEKSKKTLMTTGSVIGALAMSSCCIAPLVLFSLGITGAWIANLTALYPYKPLFFFVTAAFLAGGFYKVYHKPALTNCEPGSYCASPQSDRITKIMLWSASILVAAALAFPYITPMFLE